MHVGYSKMCHNVYEDMSLNCCSAVYLTINVFICNLACPYFILCCLTYIKH